MIKLVVLFVRTIVFIFVLSRSLCVSDQFVQDFRNCSAVQRVIVNDQSQMDELMTNISSYANYNSSLCIHLSLVGNRVGSSFRLDLLQLMRVNLGTNGSLMITGNSVIISCTTNVTDLEELWDMLQPISRALLVFLDGLVFTRCPVPIVIEEVSTVMIQNCIFL